MLLCRLADVDEVPRRTFEQDVFGFIGHFGFGATHHACQRERTFFVTDQNIRGSELAFYTVKRCKFLTIFCSAGADLYIVLASTFLENIVIKGVQRLALIEHGIVGRIHDIADGTDSRKRKRRWIL